MLFALDIFSVTENGTVFVESHRIFSLPSVSPGKILNRPLATVGLKVKDFVVLGWAKVGIQGWLEDLNITSVKCEERQRWREMGSVPQT